MISESTVRQTRAYNCIDCGICTGSCPVARVNGQFSPRMNVERVLVGLGEEVEMDREIWSCITCGLCTRRCPSTVDYLRFIQEARASSVNEGLDACIKTHTGIFAAMQRLQAHSEVRSNRISWLTDDLKVSEHGQWLYFTGCVPFFHSYFDGDGGGLGGDLLETARGAVRLLNAAGIVPAVRADERCCGHDRLWAGDEATFAALSRANMRMIRESRAKYVVATCPECVRTLKRDYATLAGAPEVEVFHISEVVARLSAEGRLHFSAAGEQDASGEGGMVTFHDPCRLGRHLEIYEKPREALGLVPDLELVEMGRSREASTCCGTSCWINCDALSETIRLERLREAAATGAGTLVVACPKCQIHFRCSLSNHPEIELGVREMTSLLAAHLEGGGTEV